MYMLRTKNSGRHMWEKVHFHFQREGGYFFRSSEKERGKCYMTPAGMWAPWGNTWLSYLSPALRMDLACSNTWVHWWNACTKEQLDGWWAGWLSECMNRWMPKHQSQTSFGLLCQRAFLINYSSAFHYYFLFWPSLGTSLCSRWEKICNSSRKILTCSPKELGENTLIEI